MDDNWQSKPGSESQLTLEGSNLRIRGREVAVEIQPNLANCDYVVFCGEVCEDYCCFVIPGFGVMRVNADRGLQHGIDPRQVNRLPAGWQV